MIGGTYEYLMSSLPHLSFQNTDESNQAILGLLTKYGGSKTETLDPIEVIDSEAQKFLPPHMFYFFQKMNLRNIHKIEFQNTKSEVLSAFSSSTFDLKTKMKAWRISENGEDEKVGKNDFQKIINHGTPLEKEIQILKYQWRKLEDISVGHFSNLEAVFEYKIKLLLLLRWWSFDAEKGFAKFTQMTLNS